MNEDIQKAVDAFKEDRLKTVERNLLLFAFTQESFFEIMRVFSDSDLEKAFGLVNKFGIQGIGHPLSERALSALMFELTRRENQRAQKIAQELHDKTLAENSLSEKRMQRLTWIAIALASFQIIWEIFKTIYLEKRA